MKENKVAEAIGQVDDRFLSEAIHYQRKKKSAAATVMKWVAAAACFCLLVGSGIFYSNTKVDSVVSLDINPSIELTVSKNDKVLSAVALNEDAEKVLNGMDLKKVDLDIAINAIIGSLLKNGYLDEVYNAINVCVENDDTKRADEISAKIKSEISSIMAEKDLIGSVNSQSCPLDEALKELADKYGVSVGKYMLAKQVSDNLDIALEITVKMTISELWDLLEAEDVALLTKDDVVKIAVEDAGIDASKMVLNSVKIKETAGVYTYDIKFTVEETAEYKYKIDAVTGAILEVEYKLVLKEEPITPPEPEVQITTTEALQV
ncbi:MAG: PepSY domain-containing protein, partial [Lachnospiraceae bacterium]|nr:PepSY domain-containing protein [Lachnospiraceae bacterium]